METRPVEHLWWYQWVPEGMREDAAADVEPYFIDQAETNLEAQGWVVLKDRTQIRWPDRNAEVPHEGREGQTPVVVDMQGYKP